MANRSLHPLLLYLRRLGGSAAEGSLEDAQLLHRFLSSRDESAFTTIVQRYGAMVWGLCVRRLGETPVAEDAFQATFLVLVRKAASLRASQLLANMAGLSVVRLDNVFYVTTAENAKHLREEQAKINADGLIGGAGVAPTPAPAKRAK